MVKEPGRQGPGVVDPLRQLFEANPQKWMQGESIETGGSGRLIHACSMGIINYVSHETERERTPGNWNYEGDRLYGKAVELLGRQLGKGPA